MPGVLAPDTRTLRQLPEPQLREVAWWSATEAVRHTGLASDPDITACIAARTLTAPAEQRARRSLLHHGAHPWLWRALHNTTNSEPVAAAAGAVDAARYCAGPHATQFVAAARRRLGLSDHPKG